VSTQQIWLVPHIIVVGAQSFKSFIQGKFNRRETLNQMYEFGVGCLGIVCLCVTFVGIIITLEYSYHMKLIIGNDSLIPSFAMIMLSRELAPAVTALLLVSKMGASISAELGAMKTTEQLDAYRLLGLNVTEMFVVPRIIASALANLCLAFIALFIAILGGWLAAVAVLNYSTGSYFASLFLFTHASDLVLCGLKAFLFGLSIPIISSTMGFRCQFGSEGVGIATTDAVVANSIWIIILDFILTFAFSVFAS